MTQILLAFLLSTSVSAASFDVWEVDPQGMAIFIWTQHGDPELTQQHQILLENSIEKDFALAGKYYPTPAQLADFYMTWFASAYPGNKEVLRTSIIDWESIEISQADIDRALADDKLDYVRRYAQCSACPSDLVRDGVVSVCTNPTEDGPCRRGCTPWCDRLDAQASSLTPTPPPSRRRGGRVTPAPPSGAQTDQKAASVSSSSRPAQDVAYRVVNAAELERRYYSQVRDRNYQLKNFARRIRGTRYSEEHPNKQTPNFHTSSGMVKGRPEYYAKMMKEAHVRAYDYDRDEVFAGVIMENIIREIEQSGR